MSNNFDWNSMLGGGAQPSASVAPQPEKQPTDAPLVQDDANALLNADTQQAIRDGAQKAKATTKAAAVGMRHQIKRLVSLVHLHWFAARLDRINRRLERQTARTEARVARMEGKAQRGTAKVWIFGAVAVAIVGAAVGGWLHLRTDHSAPAAQTHAVAHPTPAPATTVKPQATPMPTAPAPQAESKATAVEVAKPLPPKRPKAGTRDQAPQHTEPKKNDDNAWQDKANADLDSFFNQNK